MSGSEQVLTLPFRLMSGFAYSTAAKACATYRGGRSWPENAGTWTTLFHWLTAANTGKATLLPRLPISTGKRRRKKTATGQRCGANAQSTLGLTAHGLRYQGAVARNGNGR
jgi:hypothetical protein